MMGREKEKTMMMKEKPHDLKQIGHLWSNSVEAVFMAQTWNQASTADVTANRSSMIISVMYRII